MDPIPEVAQLQWDFMDPLHRRYAVIRPLVLFTAGTATHRAQDTDLPNPAMTSIPPVCT